METTAEVLAKNGTEGSEELFLHKITHCLYTPDQVEELCGCLSQRQAKKFRSELTPVIETWTWEVRLNQYQVPVFYKKDPTIKEI